jgi:D-alanyl-D-alanine carboxypeptidase/D-alanyl-D-alanine-endopeptidase (penicillin-binding protein 4)
MLLTSDGTLAESLARVTSRVAGGDGTRASLQTVIPAQLKNLGLDVSKVTIHDGSGLSTSNKVAPKFVTQLVKLMLEGKNNLNYVYNSLSIAGETGSLTSRFTGANVIAKGAVFAKTGWIDTEYSLAGLVAAADGSRLAFAFYAIGDDVKDNAKAALDTLTTGIYSCGNNLSNK